MAIFISPGDGGMVLNAFKKRIKTGGLKKVLKGEPGGGGWRSVVLLFFFLFPRVSRSVGPYFILFYRFNSRYEFARKKKEGFSQKSFLKRVKRSKLAPRTIFQKAPICDT